MIPQNSLPISNRTVFLDVTNVRVARGISADKVNELVESGKLLWVFNVGRTSNGVKARQLRFWLPEVLDPAAVRGLRLDDVVSKILPEGRNSFNGSEIGQWFLISRPTVMRIGKEMRGIVKNRLLHVERHALAGYLTARWLGSVKSEERVFAS
jgi:hypothetical protein